MANGKGSRRRPTNEKAFAKGYIRVYGQRRVAKAKVALHVTPPGYAVYRKTDDALRNRADEQFVSLKYMSAEDRKRP